MWEGIKRGRREGFQEQLYRTHGQNQGGWKQGREVGMAGSEGVVGVNADNYT